MRKATAFIAILLIVSFPSAFSFAKDFETRKCGDECLEIKTRGGPVYRVYACGKLEKMVWEELNPNEEPGGITFSGGTIDGAVYSDMGTASLSAAVCWDGEAWVACD